MQLMNGISNNPISDSFFITEEYATALAKRLPANYMEDAQAALLDVDRSILNVYPLQFATAALPAAYVINYANNEGFAIISADARYEPILSFGSEGQLLQNDTIPSMMAEWLGYVTENIYSVRQNTYNDISAISNYNQRWQELHIEGDINNIISPSGDVFTKPGLYGDDTGGGISCSGKVNVVKGPLLTTRWGQDKTYNDSLPNANCNPADPQYPTGCVATATAQILKYYSKPNSSYNYASMPDAYANSDLAKLMKDLGQSSYLNMTYACDGSGANSARVTGVLKNKFSYSSASDMQQYNNSKFQNIVNDIIDNKVVFLSASEEYYKFPKWLFGYTYGKGGHAWVCDGYKIDGNQCGTRSKWLHMNWGWDGYYNRFFHEDNWNPGSNNFRYDRTIIFNIQP